MDQLLNLMGTRTGNPAWKDYPDTSTRVYASHLNAIEDALDTSVESSTVRSIWRGSQVEYDNIILKNPDTLYIVVG